jgi:sulfur-oxidizing protein SoxY
MKRHPNKPISRRQKSRRQLLVAMIGGALAAPFAWAAALMARPVAAFRADTVAATLAELYPGQRIRDSDEIRVAAADLAENGAVVPIKVTTDLADVRSVSIIASANPVPLVATFVFGPRTNGIIATRIKLAESCDVVAVVETANGCYRAQKSIEVTIGGCGV